MALPDLKWHKIKTARAFNLEHRDRLCSWFNIGEWKSLNESGFFKVKYYNPKVFLFQHMCVEENVFSDRKNRYEENNLLRNGVKTQHLTSVDIQEVVTSGGFIVKILVAFICDILDINPLERFIIEMTD